MKGYRSFKREDSQYRELIERYIGVSRLHRTVLERELNKTGVYRSQHQLLMYIADNPNASQKEIAQQNHVTAATAAVSLKKLEQGGYICRVVDEQDNRYNKICITEKGSMLIEKSICYFQEVEKGIFAGFGPEELAQLHGYLNRMYENLEHILPQAEGTEREEQQ